MKVLRWVARILLLVVATSAAAAEPYLFDLLKQRPYRQAWDKMFEGEPRIPGWLIRFSRVYDGPAQPSRELVIGGARYRLADVCQPHDCGDNSLVVLFSPGAQRAWGLLKEDGRRRFLGKPDEAVRRVLANGL